jgi:hypothetical protein
MLDKLLSEMRSIKKKRWFLFLVAVLGVGLFWGTVLHNDRKDSTSSSPENESISASMAEAIDAPFDELAYSQLKERAKITSSKREAIRRKNWEHRFPWKPTTDPNVVITQEIIDVRLNHPVKANHGFLKAFFENEARFTPQFEQLHDILNEHGRANNPVAAGQLFQNLWLYHQAIKHDPESIRMHSPNPWTQPEPVIDRNVTVHRAGSREGEEIFEKEAVTAWTK